MSEAVYLHRPVLAEPVGKQFEQILNARYLASLGYGMCAEPIDEPKLRTFLERVPELERNLAAYAQDGNQNLLAKLDEVLQSASQGGGPIDADDPTIA
jgi:UDP:flavonoid glycosyltransferase YjiC (YdhE family)